MCSHSSEHNSDVGQVAKWESEADGNEIMYPITHIYLYGAKICTDSAPDVHTRFTKVNLT